MKQIRKCLQCGKEFIIYSHNRKYCSKKCTQRYWYTQRHNMNWPKKKECIVCGKEFLVDVHMMHRKYCSERCQGIYFRNQTKHRVLCLCCKKEFRTNSTTRRYCSYECQRKYHSRNRPDRPSEAYLKRNFPSYICQNCGHKFKLNFDLKSEEGKIIFRYMKCPKCSKR